VEQDISQLLDAAAVQLIAEKEYEYQLKVSGQEQANLLLSMLIARQISIITFDLREPSLHEIFVKVVGESNEAE